jgi:hypothetical protein
LSRSNSNSFQRSELFTFTKDQIELFEKHLLLKVISVVERLDSLRDREFMLKDIDDLFEPNYTCCDEKYGMCEFAPLCRIDSENREVLISTDYTIKQYDPRLHQI